MSAGINRQIVRILLPRSADNDQLLQYYETSDVEQTESDNKLVLCPTDETWQGGIMQLYRAASYASQEILRYVPRVVVVLCCVVLCVGVFWVGGCVCALVSSLPLAYISISERSLVTDERTMLGEGET